MLNLPSVDIVAAVNRLALTTGSNDYVVGQWEGGGTHTGPAFDDFLMGSLPPATGYKMHFTGITVLKVAGGKIIEEIGLDDAAKALIQLGIIAHPLTPS